MIAIRKNIWFWTFLSSVCVPITVLAKAENRKKNNAEYIKIAIGQCAQIKNNKKRLNCFDNLSGKVQILETENTKTDHQSIQKIEQDYLSSEQSVILREKSRNSIQDETFGLPYYKRYKTEEKPNQHVLEIKNIQRNFYGKLIIITQIGQVWKQIDTKRVPVSKTENKQVLIIRKNRLGGFTAHINKSRSFQIQREK